MNGKTYIAWCDGIDSDGDTLWDWTAFSDRDYALDEFDNMCETLKSAVCGELPMIAAVVSMTDAQWEELQAMQTRDADGDWDRVAGRIKSANVVRRFTVWARSEQICCSCDDAVATVRTPDGYPVCADCVVS
jgi:hypothetical protein